jgi:tetratricopeptide (TPR) repeat protein
MSKYNTDLDYVILNIDISREELEEIKAEADKIIFENKESDKNLAVAYLKKAQCLRKLGMSKTIGFIFYDEYGFFINEEEEELKNLLKKALELSPDMPEVIMQLGLLNRSGVLEKNLLSKAIQLKPDYAAAFNNRAMIIYDSMIENQEDKDKNKIYNKNAVADLTEAIRMRPFDAIYHLNRGVFHSRLEEHKEAIEDFSNAINFASDVLKYNLKTDVKIFNLRGKEYTELKEYDKAIEDFSETLRLKHKCYDKLIISEEEREYYEILESHTNYDETFLFRGKAYYMAGEKDKAKTDIKEYINRKRKDTDTNINDKIIELIGFMPEDIL